MVYENSLCSLTQLTEKWSEDNVDAAMFQRTRQCATGSLWHIETFPT